MIRVPGPLRGRRGAAAAAAVLVAAILGLAVTCGGSDSATRHLSGSPRTTPHITSAPTAAAAPSEPGPGALVSPPPLAQSAIPAATAAAHPRNCSGALCHYVPETIVIPDIRVNAYVELLGLTPSGDADVPHAWQDAGWFDHGYYPGARGNGVILGHLDTDNRNSPEGVFWNLHRLQPGNRIQVVRGDGSSITFAVRLVQTLPVSGFPLAAVFGPADHPVLRLLTCAGRFVGPGPGYDSRTVVTADLV